METKNIGLRDIPIADTKISMIDGEKGKLIYRGFDVLDLTKNSNFEECCFLLLHDHLPNKIEFDEFVLSLKEARKIPEQMQKNMRNWRKMRGSVFSVRVARWRMRRTFCVDVRRGGRRGSWYWRK